MEMVSIFIEEKERYRFFCLFILQRQFRAYCKLRPENKLQNQVNITHIPMTNLQEVNIITCRRV